MITKEIMPYPHYYSYWTGFSQDHLADTCAADPTPAGDGKNTIQSCRSGDQIFTSMEHDIRLETTAEGITSILRNYRLNLRSEDPDRTYKVYVPSTFTCERDGVAASWKLTSRDPGFFWTSYTYTCAQES